MTRSSFALILAVLGVWVGPLPSQVTTGTILGTVRDSTGAAVPGAQVTITEINKGTSLQFVTDDTGAYTAPFLTPGTYSVAVEKPGFKR
ncbi:MAG: carboxypeptidase-like regulatory domain-containing protein, partial [Bryobacteraceae bacterium]